MSVIGTVATQHETVLGVEPSPHGSEARVAMAQVPLAQHVGPVPQSSHLFREEGEGLIHPRKRCGSNYVVLHSKCVWVPWSKKESN